MEVQAEVDTPTSEDHLEIHTPLPEDKALEFPEAVELMEELTLLSHPAHQQPSPPPWQ